MLFIINLLLTFFKHQQFIYFMLDSVISAKAGVLDNSSWLVHKVLV